MIISGLGTRFLRVVVVAFCDLPLLKRSVLGSERDDCAGRFVCGCRFFYALVAGIVGFCFGVGV